MNDTVARHDVGIDDLGHFVLVTRIASALLKDIFAAANGSAVIAISHLHAIRAVKIRALQLLVGNNMKKKDVCQGGDVIQQSIESTRGKVVEGIVSRSEDGERTFSVKCVGQVSSLDSSAESFKSSGIAGNLSN